MSDAKFTKGTWEIREDGKHWLWIGPTSWVKRVCRVGLYGGAEHEDKANAQLIAAAPDLYEALKELTEIIDGALMGVEDIDDIDSFTCQPARAALAKARGES